MQEGMPVADVVALSKCDSEPKQTIALLEKKLADKKIDLPHDDRIAQPAGSTSNTQ
jgi:antitoxin (DNA-binding transcriptional repressor) of toxin-antitoxin stability system